MPKPFGERRSAIGFVQIELKLARTFCHLADLPRYSERARCIQHARAAYRAAARFMFMADMSDQEFASFSANLEQVGLLLETLESR